MVPRPTNDLSFHTTCCREAVVFSPGVKIYTFHLISTTVNTIHVNVCGKPSYPRRWKLIVPMS